MHQGRSKGCPGVCPSDKVGGVDAMQLFNAHRGQLVLGKVCTGISIEALAASLRQPLIIRIAAYFGS